MHSNNSLHFRSSVDDESLLGREPILLDQDNIIRQIKNSDVLITGAAGSIGSELATQVCGYQPRTVILIDQSETCLSDLEIRLAEKFPVIEIHAFIASVTDQCRISDIFCKTSPQIVFHAAAYKHVPIMEKHPYEAIKTNVIGTEVVAQLALKHRVSKFIFISTDKAVNPSGVMGASKRLAEMYIQAISLAAPCSTDFMITRFGNVLGSNGSFLSIFKKQITAGGPVTVTHPEVARYLMTAQEACQLVLEASAVAKNGEVVYFDMGPLVLIRKVAEQMICQAGFHPEEIGIEYVGLRPGEKLAEDLFNQNEIRSAFNHPKIRLVQTIQSPVLDLKTFPLIIRRVLDSGKADRMVMFLKQMIPEYISSNSDFERLDCTD